ncbi:putative PEP-binding protein [Shigella boydii]
MKEKLAEAKQHCVTNTFRLMERSSLHYAGSTVVMFIIDPCCEEIDFFSIGSNDLTQYLLAVDRDNAKVTRHYS